MDHKIPESQFLKLKQYHLRKIAVSRELDKTPHTPLRKIRKRLREQESSLKAARVDTGGNQSSVSGTR